VSVSRRRGGLSSVRPKSVPCDNDNFWVALSDGRMIPAPAARATRQHREACRISSRGLHWGALDEDISVAGLLSGFGDQTRSLSSAVK
jgi:Protein of unknown function (DUF2442)